MCIYRISETHPLTRHFSGLRYWRSLQKILKIRSEKHTWERTNGILSVWRGTLFSCPHFFQQDLNLNLDNLLLQHSSMDLVTCTDFNGWVNTGLVIISAGGVFPSPFTVVIFSGGAFRCRARRVATVVLGRLLSFFHFALGISDMEGVASTILGFSSISAFLPGERTCLKSTCSAFFAWKH